MKRKLTPKETLAVASLLFGLFFGAGNLIFPVHMGQAAGRNYVVASMGFIVTGVGLPLLGVAAMGLSRSESLAQLAGQVGKGYGRFFTVLLYLTIGPCFAIPRCATTSFTVGVEPLLTGNDRLWLLGFSLVFFLLVLFFSLRPSGILTWVGRVINPVFLILLSLLVIASFANPMASVPQVAPEGDYVTQPFLTGFLEGYNTMDTLAALAFGITIVQVLRQLGLRRTDHVELVCGGDYLTTVWKKDYRGSFGWDSLETLHAEILRRGFRAVGDTFSSILASREQPDGSIINYHLTRTKIYT